MRDKQELLSKLNNVMLYKLEKRDYKGCFPTDIMNLLFLLKEEVIELSMEVMSHPHDCEAIQHEAADIANYAGMIVLACEKGLCDDT